MDPVVTGDVGARLRTAREQRGVSLSEAANRTRLSIAVLQAIERNDFASLPGGMFRKAYVRTLAAEFGLDPDEIGAEYCARFEPPGETAPVSPDAALEKRWLRQLSPSPRRSVITLVALAVPAAAWFILQPGAVRSRVPPVVLAVEPLLEARPTAAVAHATTTIAPLRIEMAAIDWCWVAAASDGERVMYRLVEPGERVRLEGRQLISLRLGDAGAVTLSINDGPTRSPGRVGEVAEIDVTLDNVDGLRDGPAAAVSDAGD
jgi:cytoskeleton protein RodZ